MKVFVTVALFATLFITAIKCSLTPIELTEKALNAQSEWLEIWKDLINKGEIDVFSNPNAMGENVYMYVFSGQKVKGMVLSDVFKLLRNWNLLASNNSQDFFQMNIGGEDCIFRLQKDQNNQIVVYDRDGKAPVYEEIFSYFKSQVAAKVTTQGEIIRQMLKSAGEKLGEQTPFTFKSAEKLKKMMRDLMLVGQIAEAATMTDDLFNFLKEQFEEAEKFRYETVESYWESNAAENFNQQNRKIYDTSEEYRKLYQLSKELLSASPDEVSNLQQEISSTLPEPSDAFFEGLKAAASGMNVRQDIEEIVDNLGVEKLTEAQYTNITEAIDVLLFNSTNEEEIEYAKKEILDNVPPLLTSNYYDELANSSAACAGNAEVFASKKWNDFVAKKFVKDYENISKNGRVPGQDLIFRQTIDVIAKDYSENFEIAFTELYPIHHKKGILKARTQLFGEGYWLENTEEKGEQQKSHKEDIKAAANGKGDSDTIKKAVTFTDASLGSYTVTSQQKKMKLIEDSFDWKDDVLIFETIDENGRRVGNEVELKLEAMSLPKYVKETIAILEELGMKREDTEPTSPPNVDDGANKTLGIYEAFIGILSSAKSLQRENYGEAAFSALQSIYATGGMGDFSKVVEEVSAKAFVQLMSYTADNVGAENPMEKMVELAKKAVGASVARVLEKIAEKVPFIGIAFDLYTVGKEIKDLADKSSDTPFGLKMAHLVHDMALMRLSEVESLVVPEDNPFIEPFIIAQTMIKSSIDDFYMDVKKELTQVEGKDFADKVAAFYRGYEEGIASVFDLKLFPQLQSLQEQVDSNHELISNMTDPAKYLKYRLENASQGDLDFTYGIISSYGEFLDAKILNNGSVKMIVTDIPNEELFIKTFHFPHPVSEIVLGVGEVDLPMYMQEAAYLWILVPVKSDDNIADLDKLGLSRYGVYTGNDKNNTFYAIQIQTDHYETKATIDGSSKSERYASSAKAHHHMSAALPKRHMLLMKRNNVKFIQNSLRFPGLKHQAISMFTYENDDECNNSSTFLSTSAYSESYNYKLCGEKGDDKFFLGPQQALVLGGEGRDLYYIQPTGGKAIIDNFAIDEETDTLYFNASYNNIKCARENWDLIVGICDTHVVRVKNWFNYEKNEFYRHINIVSKDGILMSATRIDIKESNYSVSCNAVIIDKTGSTEGQRMNLTGRFSHVKDVYGSDFSDIIIGNELPNLINAGKGHDIMEGKGGKDVYVINSEDGNDTINNYAEDFEQDIIIFSVHYMNIVAINDDSDLVLYDITEPSHHLRLNMWFSSSLFQHAVFLSKDYIQFTVELNTTDVPVLAALTIDLDEFEQGVVIDLNDSRNNINYTLDAEVSTDIKVIFDSKYNDRLIGNALDNFLTCTNGRDFLKGNSGKDTYFADETCSHLTIDNFDDVKDIDLLLIRCLHDQLSLHAPSNSLNLVIKCTLQNSEWFKVELLNWFSGFNYQHLFIKTDDLVTSFLPSSRKELKRSKRKPIPIEIQKKEGCNNQIREIDLRLPENRQIERVEASNDNCSYVTLGNSMDNYIDPGPGNPYSYQHLEGANGTDVYVLGHSYGLLNRINNFAEDNQTDHLKFQVIFDDIVVQRKENDVVISSKAPNGSVQAVIANYFKHSLFQHMVVETADNFMFRFKEEYPYIEVIMADFSSSLYSQIIATHENTLLQDAIILIGSKTAENHIEGGLYSEMIVGGSMGDSIYGGPGEEDLIGGESDDFIHGGQGNDGIYGGEGDDILFGDEGDDLFFGDQGGDVIHGGNGSDFVVFSGINYTGVTITLQVGIGLHSDAADDTYESIENILGSEFDDTLIGNDDNNIIRGYAGCDTLFPYGGFDLLHGGVGSDLYMLEEASGPKVINNFATDGALDMISLKNYSSSRVCYFYLEEDLIMNIDFDVNDQDTIGRIITAENFLEVTIANALKNTTYQHLLFFFSDVQMHIGEFTEEGNQIGAIYNHVYSGYFLHISCFSETVICVNINFTAINIDDVSPENYVLKLIRVNHNSSFEYPLSYIYSGGTEAIKLENLQSGVENTFFGYLSSCELSVTFSPLISTVTIPNPPVNLVIDEVVFDGFTIHWDPPSITSDPLIEIYSYVIKVISGETNEYFEYETSETSFTAYNLLPQTEYNVLVHSKSHNTSSRRAAGLNLTTDDHTCSYLNDLQEHLYFQNFARNDQGVLTANLSCMQRYRLIGSSTVYCDQLNTIFPRCESLACSIPTVGNATLLTSEFDNDTNKPLEGDILTWKCNENFEVNVNITDFSSTCQQDHTWKPPPAECELLPTCEVMPPRNGSASSNEIYVGENVTYQCDHGYALVGPVMKHCFRTYYSSLDLIPLNKTFCERIHCPSLIPQTDGMYSRYPPYYEDSIVILSCYFGFYVSDRIIEPQKGEYQCIDGGNWNDTVKLCKTMIAYNDVVERIKVIQAQFKWSFSAWTGDVDSDYYYHGCLELGGIDYESTLPGGVIQCQRSFHLAHGPSEYEGILAVSDREDVGSVSYVCIESTAAAQEICDALDYDYTTSIYQNASVAITTKVLDGNSIDDILTDGLRNCTARISCRARCNSLHLPKGKVQCFRKPVYEGDKCSFQCNNGYYLIGDEERQCTANGWTGNRTFCDGEIWKREIERVTRLNSNLTRPDLALTLYLHLHEMYGTNVKWFIVIYDNVSGSEMHDVSGIDYYHLFRYYGNNIVVLRMVFPRNRDEPEDLEEDFLKAYEPYFDGMHINAEETAQSIWDNLPHQKIEPWNIFVLRDGIDYAAYGDSTPRIYSSVLPSGEGFAVVMGEKYEFHID